MGSSESPAVYHSIQKPMKRNFDSVGESVAQNVNTPYSKHINELASIWDEISAQTEYGRFFLTK